MRLFRPIRGLRTEVVASVTLLTVLAMVLVGALAIQSLQHDSTMRQIQWAHRASNILRSAMERMVKKEGGRVSGGMKADILAMMAEIREEGGVNLLWVDEGGRVLGGKAAGGQAHEVKDEDFRRCIQGGVEVTKVRGDKGVWPITGERRLTIWTPLYSPHGKVWGALRVEVPLVGAGQALLRSGWVLLIYVILVMGVLVLFGSYLLSRNVLAPLKRLMGASEQIARGDYEVSWDGYPPHEVGRLAEALQRMAASLQAHEEALRRRLDDLERSNRALVQAHQAMVRSEKLASVGRLASGVAHEIGNPIGTILGYVEILLRDAKGEEERDCLLRVLSEGERIQRTLGSLLNLARPGKKSLGWVGLEEVVSEALSLMAGHQGMKGIQVSWEPRGDGHRIWADRDQLQQVVINLILNALDAMGGRGTLTLGVGTVAGLPEEADLVPPPRRRGEPAEADFSTQRRTPPPGILLQPGPYAFLQVQDTGPGIPAGDLPDLFEPFFTTKDPGKGTGLGLTVCLGIVESYGGRIQVRSEPGKGTCFTVYLPVGGPDREA